MKIYQVNILCGSGSTGRIAVNMAKKTEAEGGQCRIAYGRSKALKGVNSFKAAKTWEVYWHILMTRITGRHGLYSKRATRRLIHDIQAFQPDVIHLHNIHGYYLNYEILFAFLKQYGKPIQWTLHDCWAFTGHCAYFTMAGCEQWKKQCEQCIQLREYPVCWTEGDVAENFRKKRNAFTNVPNMELIVPSEWLKKLVEQSFLKEYPIEVVYNTVDTTVFRPTKSNFREKHGLQDKKIILGVANIWNTRKGLKDLVQLAQMLDESYAVVIVGLTRKQIRKIPAEILELERTDSICELAGIHTESNLFVNSSREETYGLTMAEAMVCDTKTAVYQGTACEEVVSGKAGIAVPPNVEDLYEAVTGYFGETEEIRRGNSRIYAIPKTNNVVELAAIYTASDIFVNPTREDNYPTVNLEARACGTMVITYDVGGCRETLLG